jgi:hypothetical protein
MEKLVLKHFWGDEGCSGEYTIPFEYKSKDDFVYDVLEKSKNHDWDIDMQLFGTYFSKEEIETIEDYVYTLEEWFKKNKFENESVFRKMW